jgi:hypothetical protein
MRIVLLIRSVLLRRAPAVSLTNPMDTFPARGPRCPPTD